jgi:hypothetical protein
MLPSLRDERPFSFFSVRSDPRGISVLGSQRAQYQAIQSQNQNGTAYRYCENGR